MEGIIECAVCLQPSIHPVKLPCNHIFCFLCVKGVTIQSQRCPMCRREIPTSFLEHPTLVTTESHNASEPEDDNDDDEEEQELGAGIDHSEYKWYYQGRNGWWEYDARTAQEIEHHHKKGDKHCELLIAGFLYSIDLENMLQCRRNEPHRKRQIKRDLPTNVTDKKGIAGIRTNHPPIVDDLSDQMATLAVRDGVNERAVNQDDDDNSDLQNVQTSDRNAS